MCSLPEGRQPWLFSRWRVCVKGKRTILWRLNLCIYDVHQSQRVRASAPFSMGLRSNRPVMLRQKGERVRYVIDRMTMSDVPRVIEIERLAYPSTWPPSAYRKELQDNRWAHYIVFPDKRIPSAKRAVHTVQDPHRV